MHLTEKHIREINGIVSGRILTNEPLSRFTTFRIGGPADVVAEPADAVRLAELLRYLTDENVPRMILGSGTNVLFHDEGFAGVVIRTASIGGLDIHADGPDHAEITVGAGVLLQQTISRTTKLGWTGLEDLWGIPGSFGGAVAGNAGAGATFVSDRLTHVILLSRHGEELKLERKSFDCGYRFFRIPTGSVIIQGTFDLSAGSQDEIQARLEAARARRQGKQPVERPSAGCVFKNPPSANPAGAILDRLGCKGMTVGDAQVSELHANFIINRGAARASDVLELIERLRSMVRTAYSIELEQEIRVIGRTG